MNIVMVSTMSSRSRFALEACLLLGLMLGRTPHGGVNHSTCGGPYGGEIRFVTVDPQTPNTLFAGVGSADGFYLGRNWGLNWSRVPVPPDVAIQACAVHPENHFLVLAASDTRIFRSTDGGESWTVVQTITGAGRNFSLDAQAPGVVYLATSSQVYKSTNRGSSWSQKSVPAGVEIESISMPAGSPDILLLGTAGSGILRTTDGGDTWATAWSGPAQHLRVQCHPSNPQTMYASFGPPLHPCSTAPTEVADGRPFLPASPSTSWSSIPSTAGSST